MTQLAEIMVVLGYLQAPNAKTCVALRVVALSLFCLRDLPTKMSFLSLSPPCNETRHKETSCNERTPPVTVHASHFSFISPLRAAGLSEKFISPQLLDFSEACQARPAEPGTLDDPGTRPGIIQTTTPPCRAPRGTSGAC